MESGLVLTWQSECPLNTVQRMFNFHLKQQRKMRLSLNVPTSERMKSDPGNFKQSEVFLQSSTVASPSLLQFKADAPSTSE